MPANAQAPQTRLERRRNETRRVILAAGQKLFAKHGKNGVTVDDIAAAADIAKGSFYSHFVDKEAFASAIIALIFDDAEAVSAAACVGVDDAAVRVVRSLCVMLSYAASYPERVLAYENLSQGLIKSGTESKSRFADDIRRGVETGRFRGVTVEVAILLVVGFIRATQTHFLAQRSSTPVAELATAVGQTLLRGLGVADAEAATLAEDASRQLLPGGDA